MLYLSLLAWLKSGAWPTYDLQMLWDEMQQRVEWKSAQRIIEMAPTVLLRLPLWIAFLIIGAGVNALGFLGNRALDDPIKLRERW